MEPLTAEEQQHMIAMVRSLSPGEGRKSYKMTRNRYEELLEQTKEII